MYHKTSWRGLSGLLFLSLLLLYVIEVQCANETVASTDVAAEQKKSVTGQQGSGKVVPVAGAEEVPGAESPEEDPAAEGVEGDPTPGGNKPTPGGMNGQKFPPKSNYSSGKYGNDDPKGYSNRKPSRYGAGNSKRYSGSRYGQDYANYEYDRGDYRRGQYDRSYENDGVDPSTFGQDYYGSEEIYEDGDSMAASLNVWIRSANDWDRPDKSDYRGGKYGNDRYGKGSKRRYSKNDGYKGNDYKDNDYDKKGDRRGNDYKNDNYDKDNRRGNDYKDNDYDKKGDRRGNNYKDNDYDKKGDRRGNDYKDNDYDKKGDRRGNDYKDNDYDKKGDRRGNDYKGNDYDKKGDRRGNDYKDNDYDKKGGCRGNNYKDNDYDKKGGCREKGKYKKVTFPARYYKNHKKFPINRFPPLFSTLPWLPIFYDKITYQTFIMAPTGGIIVLPPLINFIGQRFAVAQLIKSGYASLVSTGAPPLPGFNPAPLLGPAVAPGGPPPLPFNPQNAQFNGGVTPGLSGFGPRP